MDLVPNRFASNNPLTTDPHFPLIPLATSKVIGCSSKVPRLQQEYCVNPSGAIDRLSKASEGSFERGKSFISPVYLSAILDLTDVIWMLSRRTGYRILQVRWCQNIKPRRILVSIRKTDLFFTLPLRITRCAAVLIQLVDRLWWLTRYGD